MHPLLPGNRCLALGWYLLAASDHFARSPLTYTFQQNTFIHRSSPNYPLPGSISSFHDAERVAETMRYRAQTLSGQNMNSVAHVFKSGHGDSRTAGKWLGSLRPEISSVRPEASAIRLSAAKHERAGTRGGGDIFEKPGEVERRTKQKRNRNREVRVLLSRWVKFRPCRERVRYT